MGNPKISVVFSTYNRAHLLWRSLWCYQTQLFPLDQMEFIVIDDWSEDETNGLLINTAINMNLTVVRPPYKKPGLWRDCAATINIGLRAAKGDIIIATHPEIMVGKESIFQIAEHCQDHQYMACKPYYLTPNQQEHIDDEKWMVNGVLAIRNLPRFYEEADEIGGNPDYTHHAMDAHQNWGSWVFGAMTRNTWKEIGGMAESDHWGAIDLSFLARRNLLGIPTLTCMEDSTKVVHQNHDLPSQNRSLTPRTEPSEVFKHAGKWDKENAKLTNV